MKSIRKSAIIKVIMIGFKANNEAGFTLIELLVVMAVIGILATIAIGSFQSSQTKARDAQRKNDLNQISKALETYYNDKGQYPDNSAANKIDGCADVGAGPVTCDWGTEWSDENGTVYMVELPADPRASGLNYYYISDGSFYQLYARLENDLDSSIPTLLDESADYGISCGGGYNCNYGVSSSNIAVDEGRTIE